MRLLLVSLVLLAGCQGTVGPWQRPCQPNTAITCLPSDEQEARIRDRLPFAGAGAAEGPRTYFENPLTRGGR